MSIMPADIEPLQVLSPQMVYLFPHIHYVFLDSLVVLNLVGNAVGQALVLLNERRSTFLALFAMALHS